MDLTFDPTITLGHLITAGAVVVTLIGWGVRMQLNMRVLMRQMDHIAEDLDDVKQQFSTLNGKL